MSTASTPGSAPKTMSSRLLTMKFMQRAANTSPTSRAEPSPDEPSAKRRKTDSSPSTPTKFNVDALADRSAIQTALADEEAKRQAALERQAAELGDTRWVLSFEDQQNLAAAPPLALRVVQTGFANLDASPVRVQYMDDDPEEKPVMIGRRSFGKFNKVVEKRQDPNAEDTSESDSEADEEDDSSEGESESDDPASELIRASREEAAERAKAERKAKKRAAKAELEEMAKKRRKTEVNLNGLSSLSGRQDRKPPVAKNCYTCGGNHYKKDCPAKKRGHQGGDDGPPRKSRKSR
ncbi:uncharacterized protein LY89DRAFT_581412 [Mollisia scopiformis]|uniref:Zinc knuckle protein n=1 Tax=Mollisia scopiformis TaxID=149040 RepID=A0A194XHE5_MOLSC|nr:uncharacterized protein LY89DRAFT_581412 [Mollisia scopiformis]KUJ19192.1 hypothetical protein LY89DRAFT_581412 [Mollisia scopiformis]